MIFYCRKILLFFYFRTIKPNTGGHAVSIRGEMERVGQAIRLFFSWIAAREMAGASALPAAVAARGRSVASPGRKRSADLCVTGVSFTDGRQSLFRSLTCYPIHFFVFQILP